MSACCSSELLAYPYPGIVTSLLETQSFILGKIKKDPSLAGTISRVQELQQYHTVRVDGGRMTGKTSSIATIAMEGDLIIVQDDNAMNHLLTRLIERQGDRTKRIHITTINCVVKDVLTSNTTFDCKYKRFILDDARFAFSDMLENEFLLWADQHADTLEPRFIFLG